MNDTTAAPVSTGADQQPAILGGAPTIASPYPSWPIWDDHERALLSESLEAGGWWQGDGSVARDFANAFATYHSANFGLALTNGTHTLEAAMAACDIGEGDEVIVPAMTLGLLQVWLTFFVPDGVGPEGCRDAEEVPAGVQA